MEFAKAGQLCAPLHQSARTIGVKITRCLGHGLETRRPNTKCRERHFGISFGVKDICFAHGTMPFARRGGTMPDTTTGCPLFIRLVTQKHWTNFEHRHIGLAAILITCRCGQQVWQD